jgi:hypothetical protein
MWCRASLPSTSERPRSLVQAPFHDLRHSESRNRRRSPTHLRTDQINGKYCAEWNFSWFEATTLGNYGDKGTEGRALRSDDTHLKRLSSPVTIGFHWVVHHPGRRGR